MKSLVVAMTYTSNKLEGSTMTVEEVSDVLYENMTFSNRTLIEHIETKNHEAALLYVLDNYDQDIDGLYTKRLNGMLMNSIKPDAGTYRSHNVRIHGSFVPTTNYMSIEKKMEHFLTFTRDFKSQHNKDGMKDLIRFIAEMHARFEMIHPFSDGNGRVGRLLIAHMCLQYGLLPVIIATEYRKKYIDSLQKAQLDNHYYELDAVIIRGIESCIELV